MSITTEIQRLQTAKAGLKTQLEAKGVSVSTAATLDEYPSLVSSIETTVYSGDVQSIIDEFAYGTLSGEITISSAVTGELSPYLFYNCTGITGVNYYSSGTWKNQLTIPDHCFDGCQNMTSFNFVNYSNKKLKYISAAAFKNCRKLTSLPNGFLNDVLEIRDEAFHLCPLSEITFGSGLTSIGKMAFVYDNGYNAFSGQNITFPSSLTNFTNADYSTATFQNTKATGFTFLGHVDSIGNSYSTSNYCYFKNNSECEVYDFTHNVTPVYRVASNEFQGSKENYRIIVPQVLYDTWITTQNWTNFASHIVSAENIYNFYTIEYTTTDDSIMGTGSNGGKFFTVSDVYVSGTGGKDVIYGKEDGSFYEFRNQVGNRAKITSMNIASGFTDIAGHFTDSRFSNLTGITISSPVTGISYQAFMSNTHLTNLSLPDTLKTISNQAFSDASELKTIVIPDSVETIGEKAFYYSLGSTPGVDKGRNITIGSGVTSIGNMAFFNGTSDLNSTTIVTIKATTPPTISNNTFGNTNMLFYVPAESVDDYKAASNWSSYAEYIQAIQE